MPVLSLLRSPFMPTGNIFSSSISISSSRIIKSSISALLPRTPVFQKGAELTLRHVRRYSSNQSAGAPNMDPGQQTRRKGLMILTYMSGFIGACMLTAIGAREYQKLKLRARGIEPVKNRLYGRKPILFRYRGYVLPDFVMDVIDDVHSFQVREDDVFIMSYPKSGTTWVQEIVYLICTDLDFESAKSSLEDRFPYLEYFYPGIPAINDLASPRYFKCHMPFSLLPNDYKVKKPKTIYVARNVKDVVVSLHYMLQKFMSPSIDYKISFDDFCQLFVNEEVLYGPWWKHVREAWERRHDDNVLFITYEEMKLDMPGSIRKIAAHLGKTLTHEEVDAIAAHCSFNKMKDNKFVNFSWFQEKGLADEKVSFHRKGQVGDWRNHMSKAVATKMDEMMATKLEPVGLKMRDSLGEEGNES